jgi:hypothetical protein
MAIRSLVQGLLRISNLPIQSEKIKRMIILYAHKHVKILITILSSLPRRHAAQTALTTTCANTRTNHALDHTAWALA